MQMREVMGLCVAGGFVGDTAILSPMTAGQRDAQQREVCLQRCVFLASGAYGGFDLHFLGTNASCNAAKMAARAALRRCERASSM